MSHILERSPCGAQVSSSRTGTGEAGGRATPGGPRGGKGAGRGRGGPARGGGALGECRRAPVGDAARAEKGSHLRTLAFPAGPRGRRRERGVDTEPAAGQSLDPSGAACPGRGRRGPHARASRSGPPRSAARASSAATAPGPRPPHFPDRSASPAAGRGGASGWCRRRSAGRWGSWLDPALLPGPPAGGAPERPATFRPRSRAPAPRRWSPVPSPGVRGAARTGGWKGHGAASRGLP